MRTGRHGIQRGSPSVTTLARSAGHVFGIAWAASPQLILAIAALTVVSGVTPAVSAWLSRAVLDALVAGPLSGRADLAHRSLPRFGHFTAGGAGQIAVGHALVLAGLLGATGLLSAVVPYARQYGEANLKRGFALIVQDRLFKAINSFPGLARLESPVFADKIDLARQASQGAPTALLSSCLSSAQSLITAVGFFGALVAVSHVLAIVVVIAAVPAVIAQIRMSRRRADLAWEASPAARRQIFYSRLLTDQRAAKEVRIFGLGDWLHGRMLAELRFIQGEERLLDRRSLAVQGPLGLLAAVISASGLIWTIGQIASGRLPIGDVTMLAMALAGVQGAVAGLVNRLAEAYQALLTFGHYVDVVTAAPDLRLAAELINVPRLRIGIEVRDLWFRYDEQHEWVLRGLSLFIPAGTSAAFVGLNGAGKSTLVKLICRLYDPCAGSIHWDGIDIRSMDPAELRQRIGVVFQDYTTYDLTAAENVGVGDIAAIENRDRIHIAAQQAGVHEKLAGLPIGYDTLLSRIFFTKRDNENPRTGVLLSGGQWQRVALARGLMRSDRDLLILDEPSAGLDADAEHAVHRRLLAIRQASTSLLISHRLGSVRDADMIFVLLDGSVVEQGTHEELMQRGGEYQRMFLLQASGYQDEDARRASLHALRRSV